MPGYCKKQTTISATMLPLNNNINLTLMQPAPMVPNDSIPKPRTTHHYSTKLTKPFSKKL